MSTYKEAGVDIDAGNQFAQMIKQRIAAAWPDLDASDQIGRFAGGGRVPAGALRAQVATDGPGTKVILSAIAKDPRIGQDVVAMSAVDAYVGGAMPRFLVDYMSVAALDLDWHIQVIDHVIAGCKAANCVLVGGETAEMPELYGAGRDWVFDISTTVVGFDGLDEARPTISGEIMPGDIVYAWPSGGICANGTSLARAALGLKVRPSRIRDRLYRTRSELGGRTLGEVLLKPTPIWISEIEHQRENGVSFKAHAHITGGGLAENLERVLPADASAVIDRGKWERPQIFSLIQREGSIDPHEMDRTFNQGIIMVSVVGKDAKQPDAPAIPIGEIVHRDQASTSVNVLGAYREGEE